MPTSVREQLLDAITSRVGGEYGLPAPETEHDLPVTIVQDGPDVAADDVYNQTNVEMPVVVAKAVLATDRGRDAMRAEANELLAGIISTVFTDETFGNLADSAEYTGGGIQAEVGKFVFAEAQFTVRYHHVRGNPYLQDET